jgi:hypothetical protein
MSIRTVGELREALAHFPDYRPIAVEVTVGGDLVTDVVDLDRLEERTAGHDAWITLVPAPDEYDVRALIDEGLTYRALIEAGKLEPFDDGA